MLKNVEKIKKSCIWIDEEKACSLLKIKERTFRKNCRKGKYEYKTAIIKGKKTYRVLLNSLPVSIQNKWFSENHFQELKKQDSGNNRKNISHNESDLELYKKAPAWARKQADKYILLIDRTKGLKGRKLKEFIKVWNNNNPDLRTSYSRLMLARRKYEEGGIIALLSKHGTSIGKTKIKDSWFEYFKKLYLTEGAPSLYSCWLITLGYAKRNDDIDLKEFPSVSSFKRKLYNKVPEEARYLARYGEASWNRKYAMYIDRDYSSVQAGEIWVSDHAQVDVAVLDNNCKVVFPWVTAWRDFKTGKWLGWILHIEAPNSDHIFQSFYYSAITYGLPADVYIDNGKDYRSKDFAGGRKIIINENKTTSMLGLLGIKAHFSLPYNAQTKPIERDFLKNKELLSKHMVGYRGGNVIERPEKLKKEIKQGKILAFNEFKSIFDSFILNVLNKIPSKGKVLKGKSPDQLWAEEFKEKRVVSKEALSLFCMRTSKLLTVGRNGIRDSELKVTYWAEWMSGIKGEKVYIRRDINSFQEAWVFNALNDKYLGKAYIAELVPALARSDIEKAELKKAIARKKRDKKIALSYSRFKDEADSSERLTHLKQGVNSISKTSEANPKVMKLSNTFMDKVIKEDKEMEKAGTGDISMFVPQKPEKKKIYLFETDRYYDELRNKKEAL